MTAPPSPESPAVPAPGVSIDPYAGLAASPPRRGVSLPGWLAVLIVLLVAGGFGYLGWRVLRPPPPVDLSQYDSNETGRRFFPTGPPRPLAPPANGVVVNPDGTGTVDSNGFSVRFLAGARPSLVSSARFPVPPEDRIAVRARQVALNDVALRTAAGVTDDQVKRLRAIPPVTPPTIDPPTRATLLELWAKLRAAAPADRPAAEATLMQAVNTISADGQAASSAQHHATAAAIRQVLPDAQIAKLRPGR